MRSGKPQSVSEILDGLKRTTELGTHLERARIWEQWNEIAGPALAQHGQPKTIRENTLYIEAESPVWMHRFAFKKWALLRRINRIAGKELVSDIFLLLAPEAEDGTDSAKE